MDKVMDSGSIDAGSIPVRDAKKDHDKSRGLLNSSAQQSNPRGRTVYVEGCFCSKIFADTAPIFQCTAH